MTTKIDSKKEYSWNPSFANPIAHTDINKVIKELKEIEEVYGDITAEHLIESSKNKKSVLHGYFEWDNEKAADRWRLQQASYLLRRIEVKVIKDGNPIMIRAYSLTSAAEALNKNPVYRAVDYDKPNIDFLETSSIGDLKRVRARLSPYDKFNTVVAFIDSAIEELTKGSTETQKQPAELKAVS